MQRSGLQSQRLRWAGVALAPLILILCAVAGWLKLPFWPCVMYMLVGKLGRYLVMTVALLYIWPDKL